MSLMYLSYHGGTPLKVFVYDTNKKAISSLGIVSTFESFADLRTKYENDYEILSVCFGVKYNTLTLIKKEVL